MREPQDFLPSIHAQMLDLCLEGARLASRRLATAVMIEKAEGEYLPVLEEQLLQLDHAIQLWEDRMHGSNVPR